MNDIAISQKKPTIQDIVNDDKMIAKAEKQLGDSVGSFMSSVLTLANSDPKIKELDPVELYNTCLMAASIKLPFNQNLGQAYVVPYKGKPQLQIGWKGFVQLALRTDKFKAINVTDVRQGEIDKIDRLTGEIQFNWIEDDVEREGRQVVGYVAYFKLLNGFEKQLYMTKLEIQQHASKYSQSYKKGFGPWKDDFDAMACKTVIKLLLNKYAPLSIDMAKAIEIDQSNAEQKYPDREIAPAIEIDDAEVVIKDV